MSSGEPRALRSDVANAKLMTLLRSIQSDVENQANLAKISDTITRACAQINEFEQLPKLLDNNLQWLVDSITSTYMRMKLQQHQLCEKLAELIYALTKIRGYKFVANYFSNDVYLIPNLIVNLNSDSVADFETYLNLLWLSTLVMVPFPLDSIDANLEGEIAGLALKYMSVRTNASKSQLMSLVLLANLVTRSDCSQLLVDYVESTSQEWTSMAQNFKLGHLMALNQILKRFSNTKVSDLNQIIHSKIVLHDITQLKHNPTYQVNSINVLYLIKVSSKVARIAVNDSDYTTVATVVNNYIHDIMDTLGDRFDAKLRETTAKNLSRIISYLNLKAVNYSNQLIWFVIEQLRITELRPSTCFVTSLEITSENLFITRYHMVILFLGFLALTRSAPVDFLPTILSVFHSTCVISKQTFSFVQGSQIRDASCFCAWAILKSLTMNQFRSFGSSNPNMWNHVFAVLLRVIIFDEDFTIRRCGIAVIQEFVGRFGSTYFKTVFPTKTDTQIGELTLNFVELFGLSTVSSPQDAHNLIHKLIKLGFSKNLFYGPSFDEMINKDVPFELRKLGGYHLSMLLSCAPSEVQVPILESFDSHRIINEIISSYQKGDFLILHSIGEFLDRGLLTEQEIEIVAKLVSEVQFDHHYHNADRAESLLCWYNVYLKKSGDWPPNLEANILSMTRLEPTFGLVEELSKFFTFLTKKGILLISTLEIVRLLKHGNMLLAQTSMIYLLAGDGLDRLLKTVLNSAVDADVRSDIIASLANYEPLSRPSSLNAAVLSALLDLLDDYTLTNQGDVGLKIRGACLTLLEKCELLSRHLGSALEHKLLRLAGEPMDKLRVQAFCLLCKMKYITSFETNYGVYMNDYRIYFNDLIDFYKHHVDNDSRIYFWSGIVHISGALTGSNVLINESIRQVLLILYEVESPDSVVHNLLKLLRIPQVKNATNLDQRMKKSFIVTLTVLERIFDSGVELSPSFQFEVLYVRAFNLHINTKDVTRIQLVLKIFQYISIWQRSPLDLRQKSRKRLCWLACFHALDRVRRASADCLFEIANEIDPENQILILLNSTDWADAKCPKILLQKLDDAFSSIELTIPEENRQKV